MRGHREGGLRRTEDCRSMAKKTILVVDENDNHRWICHQFLADEGHDVIAAKDGKKALKKVGQKAPDLVVFDTPKPGTDGMEAMSQLLQKNRNTAVILHTVDFQYKADFLNWAIDAYVMKSPDFGELKTKIEELLSIHRRKVE